MLCVACATHVRASKPKRAPLAPTQARSAGAFETVRADEAAVGELLALYYDDFAAGDWSGFRTRFWDDATIVTVRRTAEGGLGEVATAIDAFVVGALKRSRPLEITVDATEFALDGAAPSVVVRYRAQDRSGDAPQRWRGRDEFALRRIDGEWRIASVFVGRELSAQ